MNTNIDSAIVAPSVPCAALSQLVHIKIKNTSKFGTKHSDSTEANEPRSFATFINVVSAISG